MLKLLQLNEMRFVDTGHLARSFIPGRISHFDLRMWSASIVTTASYSSHISVVVIGHKVL